MDELLAMWARRTSLSIKAGEVDNIGSHTFFSHSLVQATMWAPKSETRYEEVPLGSDEWYLALYGTIDHGVTIQTDCTAFETKHDIGVLGCRKFPARPRFEEMSFNLDITYHGRSEHGLAMCVSRAAVLVQTRQEHRVPCKQRSLQAPVSWADAQTGRLYTDYAELWWLLPTRHNCSRAYPLIRKLHHWKVPVASSDLMYVRMH